MLCCPGYLQTNTSHLLRVCNPAISIVCNTIRLLVLFIYSCNTYLEGTWCIRRFVCGLCLRHYPPRRRIFWWSDSAPRLHRCGPQQSGRRCPAACPASAPSVHVPIFAKIALSGEPGHASIDCMSGRPVSTSASGHSSISASSSCRS